MLPFNEPMRNVVGRVELAVKLIALRKSFRLTRIFRAYYRIDAPVVASGALLDYIKAVSEQKQPHILGMGHRLKYQPNIFILYPIGALEQS